MYLKQLTCKDFRCLSEVVFVPGPAINVIRGDNAQGKTTLLEALLYLATSKSHRTNQEAELRRYGQDGFQLSATVERSDRAVVMEANWWRGSKRFKVNGVSQTRLSDILGKVNLVFFSPEDVGLVRGAASIRRRFLDMELSQLHTGYLQALQNYRQVLRQRNGLLRRRHPESALLDIYDGQLVREGVVLMHERMAFINELSRYASEAYVRITNGEELTVVYRPDTRSEDALLEALTDARPSDIKQGVTTRGPHRDDIDLLVSKKNARQFASQGQQRSAALAIKLAELALIRDRTGEYPILLLDDVLSELDSQRSQRLFEAIPDAVQCVITTTDLTDRDGLFGAECRYFHIKEGCLEAQ